MDVVEEHVAVEHGESAVLPEVEAYIYLLTAILLIDKKLYEEV
jgi:hypothetical protein